MRKKATISWITVSVIVALASLILFFGVFYEADFEGVIGDMACKQSVVSKAAMPDRLFINLEQYIPLNCETKKICITSKFFGKGECEGELGEDYETMRVSGNAEEKQTQINRILARELTGCWETMGRGELKVFSRDSTFNKKACVLYTRVSFDKSITEEFSEIKGIGRYLFTHNVPNKEISYFKFLNNYSGVNLNDFDEEKDKFTTTQKVIIFTEMDNSEIEKFITAGAGALTGAYTGGELGAVVGSVIPVVGTVVGGTVGFILGGIAGFELGEETGKTFENEKEFYGAYAFIDYKSEVIKSLGCNSFENLGSIS